MKLHAANAVTILSTYFENITFVDISFLLKNNAPLIITKTGTPHLIILS